MVCLVPQSCLTLCDPKDCSPPGSSVHGDSPGKNTGVVCHALLQGIFPTQGSNPGLLHYRQILYHLSHQGSPPLPTSSATSTNEKTAVSEKEKVQRKSQYFVPWSNLSLDKAMGFPVVMYGCESWTIKKTEHRRIDAFELWCWRRLLRVPWTARRSNQSILKEISPEYSLEGLLLKPKLQYFGHLMQRTDSLDKTLMLGKIESRRRKDNRG